MTAFEYVCAGLGAAAVPFGYVVNFAASLNKRLAVTETRLAAHEAKDIATLEGIHTTLSDLKQGQLTQTDKLDQLIYRFIPAPK